MLATKRLRTKTHLLVVLMVLFSSVGNILLSMGMKQIGSVEVPQEAFIAALQVGGDEKKTEGKKAEK